MRSALEVSQIGCYRVLIYLLLFHFGNVSQVFNDF